MPTVIITAHRGMGVTAKRRDHYIDGVKFFPENSIASFKRAIELGTDAIECDIHVSSNNIAMIIHGEKIRDYAYDVKLNKKISIPSDKQRVSNSSLETMLNKFRLKTLTDFEQQLLAIMSKNAEDPEIYTKETEELWNQYAQISPDFNNIPTLEQLLELCAAENKLRAESNRPSLKLNIELKGANSGFITLATIIAYNKKALDIIEFNRTAPAKGLNKKPPIFPIDPSDIILLGRLCVGEIITAKSLIMGARQFLIDTENMTKEEYKKKRHELLKSLLGTREQAKIHGKEELTDRQKEAKIPQSLLHGKISQKIIEKYSQDNDIKKRTLSELQILREFLREILTLSSIRTNVMLSTGDLYGNDALSDDNDDFDLQEGIHQISAAGCQLIEECMTENGYDGIDISLFDFEMETCKALIHPIQKLKENGKKPIIGATASNWKGVKKENSPITPAEALLKAHCIAQALDVDLILKVDEPGFFKTLYQPILNGKYTLAKTEELYDIDIGVDIDVSNIDLTLELDFTLVTEEDFLKTLLENNHKGYEIMVPKVVDILRNSPKPPRGPSKKVSRQNSYSDLPSDSDSISCSFESTNRVLLRKTSFSSKELLSFSFESNPYDIVTQFDSPDRCDSDDKEFIEKMEINKIGYN
jgi:glycerophosphoryl diester phosphodiesterase